MIDLPGRAGRVAPFIALSLALTLLGTTPAAIEAQEISDHRWTRNENGRSFSMSVRGKVWFTDDDTDIQRIEPDGRVMIEEKWRGAPGRMIILTPTSNGGVHRVYLLDGQTHPYDAEAQAWFAGLLPAIIRESGVGAVERARRIYGKKGATGVLDEIELIHSNSTRRIYLTTLIEGWKLSASDAARALRATGEISSNSEKASVLVMAGNRMEMSEPLVRGAYMDAARTISSSSELRRVLTELLDESRLPEETLIGALRVSSNISSNSERTALLALVAERHKLTSNELRSAFFGSADGISSNSGKRHVLVTLLRAQGTDREVVRAVVKSARSISSDSEKAAVLLEVPAVALRDSGTVEVYRQTMDTIHARGPRASVAARVAGGES